MSQDRKTGRDGRSSQEGRHGGAVEVPLHVQRARHGDRVRQTLERDAPGLASLGVAPATDEPAPPARETPPQKAHPSEPDDAPPLPAREQPGGGLPT